MTNHRFALVLLMILSICQMYAQPGWRKGEMEVMVSIGQRTDLEKLKNLGINFDLAKSDGSVVRAYMIEDELVRFRDTGIPYTVSVPDLNQHFNGYWDNPAVPPGYYSYQQIIDIADSLALNFPTICKKILMGTSYGNRQLALLKISDNVNADENEPEIMFDGGIHGDEVGTSENVIRYARDLCIGYGTNPDYTDLINSREIFLYLMVNPDGRASMSRYNQNTVDINRDAGYMWNGEGNSPDAFSQNESKSLRNCIYDNQFAVYTNYHSGTEIISYPWSYRPDPTKDQNHIDHLAYLYSSSSGYPILTYGQGFIVMYPINGSYKDVQYGTSGNVGWSIEISFEKQPPQSQIQMYYSYNIPAMTEMIKRSGYGVEGVVTDSVTGEPVRATIWVNDYYPVNTDPVVGDYHKYVLPGNYTIRVSASGYHSRTVSNVTVPSAGSVITNFLLTPDTNWYGYRVISCKFPNNNLGDEGYTPGCLGSPDNVAYSLGKNGWIVIDMGDTIFNGEGNDFKVIQAGTTPENFQCLAGTSMDGPWVSLGTGSGTTSFDLETAFVSKVRYLKIKDQSSGVPTGPDIGYDLDAIQMLTPPILVDFTVSESNPCQWTSADFTDNSTGNGISWNWLFPGGNPSSSTEQNPAGIRYDSTGTYAVSLTVSNGHSSSTRMKSGFITVKHAPEVSLGADTTICDWESITLDAGNPGLLYLWNTGDTTQTITVDSTGIGLGSGTFWADVTGLNSCVGTDTITVSFVICSGVDEKEPGPGLRLWPNPARDWCQVHTALSGGGILSLYDPLGKRWAETVLTGSHDPAVLDLTGIPAGIYIVHFTADGKIFTAKLIVE